MRVVKSILQVICLFVFLHIALLGGENKDNSSNGNFLRSASELVRRQTQEIRLHEMIVIEQQPKEFEILCTSHSRIMRWGSYRIRCRDFQTFVHHCAPQVRVTLASHQEFQCLENTDPMKEDVCRNITAARTTEELEMLQNQKFDATISVKRNFEPKPRFGKVFVDMLDEYQSHHHHDALSEGVEMIVQNEMHGQDLFSEHPSHVIPHWYNSFLADSLESSELPPFPLPKIKALHNWEKLNMVTIWNSPKTNCPELAFPADENVTATYDCINEHIGIASWYQDYVQPTPDMDIQERQQHLQELLQDPLQGTGRLYDEILWQYHVAVVPTKTSSEPKLKYGSMQRALSNMRSGVPVLLEVHGPVRQEFVEKYGYSCVFSADPDHIGEYPSFTEAVKSMRSPQLRSKCQQEGLRIAHQHYSPSTIIEQELRLLGYQGDFQCGKPTEEDTANIVNHVNQQSTTAL